MKVSQIKRILEGLGYSMDELLQVNEFRALLLSTNHGLNHHEDFIKFDSSNNIITIKNYNYKVISGRLSNNVAFNGSSILYSSNLYLRHNVYPFRVPKVGDTVFMINSDGEVISPYSKILSITNGKVELDSNIGSYRKDDSMIVYADSSYLKDSVQDKIQKALFFVYSPRTNFKNDWYLNGNELLGIELHSSIPGAI